VANLSQCGKIYTHIMRGGIQRLMTKDICSQLNTRSAVIDIGSCGSSDTKFFGNED